MDVFSIDVFSALKLRHIMQKCRVVALDFGSAFGLLAQIVAMLPVMESIQSKIQDPVFSLGDGSTHVNTYYHITYITYSLHHITLLYFGEYTSISPHFQGTQVGGF